LDRQSRRLATSRPLIEHGRLALMLALPLLMLWLMMSACATTSSPTPITATMPDCVNWKAISYSAKADSAETVRQIIASNAARKKECG
jgi:hypothetical protein